MASSITASNLFAVSSYPFANLNFVTFSSPFLPINPKTRIRTRKWQELKSLSLNFKGDYRRYCFGAVRRRCKGEEGEGGEALEAEILEFMQKSEKPEAFPTKRELVNAGRMDLVEGIVKQGGWLSLGWNLDDSNEEELSKVDEIANWDAVFGKEFGNGVLEKGVDFDQESSSLEGHEFRGFGVDSWESNSSLSASSSGRSPDSETEHQTGIGGILSRLEKERNFNFGVDIREKGTGTLTLSHNNRDDWQHDSFIDVTVAGHDRSKRHPSLSLTEGILNDTESKLSRDIIFSDFDGVRNSIKPELWRSWSIQRAGNSDAAFEAAEIAFSKSRNGGPLDASEDEILQVREGNSEPSDSQKQLNSSDKEIDHDHIRTRLKHLELELASALCSLRSRSEEFVAQKGHDSSSDDLRKLSDDLEFQENEYMNAQSRLRSIRAKLAILEGKMALAIIDAQKIVEEKQKKIDDARTALQILRTASIVWPNPASQVLLAGSYDGWTTQRKMERSSPGIFSVCLKLYPGRYEIKFIVDGIWRIDPLRPIVHNNGCENNLLIIT